MTQGLSRTLRDVFFLQSIDSQAFRVLSGFALCARAKDVFRVKAGSALISTYVYPTIVGQ